MEGKIYREQQIRDIERITMADKFIIEILADGRIKSTTDPISPANHSSASAFFKLMEELTGTPTEKTRRSKTTIHHHEHKHEEA